VGASFSLCGNRKFLNEMVKTAISKIKINVKKKKKKKAAAARHGGSSSNPSYVEGPQQKKLDVVVHVCQPSYYGKYEIGSHSRPAWIEKAGPYLQNNHRKKGWRCGSRSRAPARQEQSPEF
jgi:hypothetical protein